MRNVKYRRLGDWEEPKDESLKDQTPGHENVLLPGQTIVGVTEYSKIRMCLNRTESNKVLY